MSGERYGRWKRLLITAGIGALIWLLMMLLNGGFSADREIERLRILTDAFFVPGALLCCIGLLGIATDGGTFDMLNYGVQKMFRLILSEERQAKYPGTFYDYRQMKLEQRSRKNGTGYIALIGLLFLISAGIVLILYMQLEGAA